MTALLHVSGDVDIALNQHLDKPALQGGKRDYGSHMGDRVSRFYHNQHRTQSLSFVQQQHKRFLSLDKKEMTIWEAIDMLDQIIDESDPDTDSPQIYHAIQTAEAARKQHPEHQYEWFWVAAFIHDLGKVLAHPKFGAEPQWAVVGDSFPVGCAFSQKCVYPEDFRENPDFGHPIYSSENGIYQPGCGFDQVMMSWGHDEYLYRVCVGNHCTLPEEGLYIIRFHSFYPWHQGGAYAHLAGDKDRRMLPFLRDFQKCDLYSKSDLPSSAPDVAKLKPFYEGLITKYFPATLRW